MSCTFHKFALFSHSGLVNIVSFWYSFDCLCLFVFTLYIHFRINPSELKWGFSFINLFVLYIRFRSEIKFLTHVIYTQLGKIMPCAFILHNLFLLVWFYLLYRPCSIYKLYCFIYCLIKGLQIIFHRQNTNKRRKLQIIFALVRVYIIQQIKKFNLFYTQKIV